MSRSLDLAIVGGTVLDGTGGQPYVADVGIRDGVIEVIGELADTPARDTLAANGACVAPGFIDAHGHSDYTLLVDGRAVSQVSQGVTTEVIGNCGHGCEPLTDDTGRFTGNIYGYDGTVDLKWRTTAEYLERLRQARPAINVVPLTPAGNLRRAAMADPDVPAGAGERKRMLKLIDDAMTAGSNGISFGLEYRQEAAAGFDELVEQSSRASGGIVTVHTRDKDQRAVEAVGEAIAIGRASGASVQVSHILPRRTAPPGSLERIVESLGAARAEGLDVAFDVHTRTHGITNLSDCISANVLAGGVSAAGLDDPRWSVDIQPGDSIVHRFASSGWDRVLVFSSPHTPGAAGRSIASLSRSGGCAPWEVVRRLLSAAGDDVHSVLVACDSYEENDILDTASLPGCLVGSDATSLCPDGPLGGSKFPGAYTWAAWLYSKLARSAGRLSPSQTVRKLAADPAERFGLRDRGAVAVGRMADLVVFDPAVFGTEGSITNPNVAATGVRHVTVNGTIALRAGIVTSERSGRVLTRRR